MARDNIENILSPDAFGRLRVSEPATVFDCKLQYDEQPLLFETSVSGTGSATHNADEGCVYMTVGTASGDKVIRQSRRYCTYQPGKSQLVDITGSLGVQKENVRSRAGYGDGANGVFLEQTNDGLYLVFRSSVTGSLVEERVEQSNWNLGCRSGIDASKSQIFVVDLQWLGVGLVAAGFNVGGKRLPAHQFKNDGIRTSTYWTTATLPVRYEIENTGPTASPSEMCQICCSVQSEGGFDLDKGFMCGASNSVEVGGVGTGTPVPLLSIRPMAQFKGIVNHAGVIPNIMEISASGNSVFWELIYNGVLTGASWTGADTESAVEWDESATAVTGGTVIGRGIATAAGGNNSESLSPSGFPNLVWLTNSIDGSVTTPLTLAVRSFTGTAGVAGAMRWVEIR